MKFARITILNVVAATRAEIVIIPCQREDVERLIGYTHGVNTSPMLSDFLTYRIATGLVVIEQYPVLARFRFMPNEHDPAKIIPQLHEQCAELNVPDDIEIGAVSSRSADCALGSAKAIAQMTIEKICGFR